MSTAERILDLAEELISTRGYNGFSYHDIAPVLGITTASIHYHFSKKEQLGVAVVKRYRARHAALLGELDAAALPAAGRLRAYYQSFVTLLDGGPRVCVSGMLAAEAGSLGAPIREELIHFFDLHESWLERVYEECLADGALDFAATARQHATLVFAALQGALIVSRGRGNGEALHRTLDALRAELDAAAEG